MPIPKKVESFFATHGLNLEVVAHRTVYTVYDLAQTLREKFENITKTLLVKADKEFYLVVMPANYRLDIQKLKKVLRAKKVSLASERDMKNKFKTHPGAMLPFGALHKVGVVADKSLLKAKYALFSAGSFTESVRLKMKEYMRVADPRVAQVAKKVPMKMTAAPKKQVKRKKKTKRPAPKRSAKKVKKQASKKRIVRRR